jgi:hypothetical protein
MNKILLPALSAYQKYRAFAKRNHTYRLCKNLLTTIFVAYALILVFPQILFPHKISHKTFHVHFRQPFDESVYRVLDSADARLEKSPLYDKSLTEKIFVSDTFALYAFLNPRASGSFANTTTGIGIITNKADVAHNLVFRNAEQDNKRPLSDVIAHEVTHLLIPNKLGLAKSFALPRWKVEGYCKYVAGDTTIGFEEGVRRWKANPKDDSRYLYFKYQQMAKYLLDDEKISVEELFNRNFDEQELAAKVYAKISRN